MLEDTLFVDGYKTLGFQETIYGEFLARLRENPRLVASCLVAGERLNQEHTPGVIHTVFTSLYGNCIMQEDESYLLQVRVVYQLIALKIGKTAPFINSSEKLCLSCQLLGVAVLDRV